MTSRRQMLKSSLALAAGAVGIGAARKALGESDPPSAAATGRPPKTLSLTGRGVHAVVDGRPVGHGPQAGDRTLLSGELVDPDGTSLGRFLATSTTFESDAGAGSALESHTFQLSDGTVHGMGMAEPNGVSAFAIVGGTGRYQGARGSYVATRMPIELGGDGSAAFTMTFTR